VTCPSSKLRNSSVVCRSQQKEEGNRQRRRFAAEFNKFIPSKKNLG